MMTTIHSLPAEVLAEISGYLDVEDVLFLWLAGDVRLNLRLRHGGVTSLIVDSPLAFPRIVSQFRLKSFTLRLTTGQFRPILDWVRYRRHIPDTELPLLGNGVGNLTLDFDAALAKLVLLGPIGSIFPNLKSLVLPHTCAAPVNFSDTSFFEGLPKCLLHLRLPRNLAVGLDALLSLPCHLESLRVKLNEIPEEKEPAFRNADVFSQLTELDLSCHNMLRWSLVVPPSVVHYSCFGGPYSLKQKDHLLQLPAHLQSLTALHFPLTNPSLLQYLPTRLLQLEIQSRLPRTTRIVDVWKNLPTSITRLSLPFSPGHPDREVLGGIPPNIKYWPEYYMSGHVTRHTPPPNLIWERLTFLDSLDDNDLPFLPPTLRELDLRWGATFTSSGLAQLPPTLTTLTLEQMLDLTPLVRHLPASLIILRLVDSSCGIKDHEWQHLWPPRLQELIFTCEDRRVPFGPGFWQHFPPQLTSLGLGVEDISNLPHNMAFLPRELRSFRFRTWKRARERKITNAFFAHLPPPLLEIELLGLDHDLTPEFCLQLPKHLALMSIRSGQGNKKEIGSSALSVQLPQFNTSTGRSPLLWEFLDKIPRFLSLRIERRPPDFAIALEERQVDDLIEDCPNLAISPYEAGSGRPHNTPRRNAKHSTT